jgi:hypothetical protein
MSKIREYAGAFFGGLIGTLFSVAGLVISVFGIPLCMISIMHFWGWSWPVALVASCVLPIIPLIGWIGFPVLALIGAYFFISSNFDWAVATGQTPRTVEIGKMTTSEFENYKTSVLVPLEEQECKELALKKVGANGKLPVSAAQVCECFARIAVGEFTREEAGFQQAHSHTSADFDKRVQDKFMTVCRSDL